MKNIALLFLIAATALTILSSTAEARRSGRTVRNHRARVASHARSYDVVVEASRKESPCEAQRIVEMRNGVMAAHLLCKKVVTGDMYDAFVIRNRKRIKAANDIAVAWHMKKYGSRRKFDELDSNVMNGISLISAQNPILFCERMQSFAPLVQTLSVDELLKQQTQLELPVCD